MMINSDVGLTNYRKLNNADKKFFAACSVHGCIDRRNRINSVRFKEDL